MYEVAGTRKYYILLKTHRICDFKIYKKIE